MPANVFFDPCEHHGGIVAYDGQVIVPSCTACAACANAVNAGFALQSGRTRPDCRPPTSASSRSSKLKNAPTAGWQYASAIAAVSCAA